MKSSKEWDMVQELYEMIDDLDTHEQQEMVKTWFDNLDPHSPFLEQQTEDQQKWLYSMYERFVNGDDEAAEEYYA